MKRLIAILLLCSIFGTLLCGCGKKHSYDPLKNVETKVFIDSTGREVEMPKEITAIAASGATAQMILMTIAPDLLVGLTASPSRAQRAYFPEEMWYLPTFGQFYGSKANLNMEALIDAEPQLILDLGDKKTSARHDMNTIQRQTGIPTVFIEATLPCMAEAYRSLGRLLGREEKAEELAQYVERTLAMAEENAARIPESERLRVMYGTGTSGLDCNARGSSQAAIIETVGAVNAVVPKLVTNRGGGTTINLEKAYLIDPDVILFSENGPYDRVRANEWSELSAVKKGSYYEIPGVPHSWAGSPPSVNSVIGVWWLGNLLYPEIYDYDMVAMAQEFYRLFWNYELSEQEARELMERSTLKEQTP